MASIKAFIRTEKKNKTTKVRFRLRDGMSIDLYIPSKIEINPDHWDNKKECVKAKVVIAPCLRNEIDTSVREFKNIISLAYKKLIEANDTITSKKLLLYIDKVKLPGKYINAKGEETMNERLTFFEVYDKFIAESKCSPHRKQVYLT
ncbi:MAG: hypothetical protein LBO06_03725, partial [Bacteroidales bacterium]|nr:hypothetical protein [Bacteroidales bacterium]